MAKTADNDLEIVRELAAVLAETGLTEVELERGGLRLRVARQVSQAFVEPMQTVAATVQAAPAAAAIPAQEALPSEPAPAPSGDPVKSPMVGTAYLSPSPEADAFIKVGDQVEAGQTLLIVEAMKTMNHIKAPKAGKVIEIRARNAEPVEFDETLVLLGS